MIEASVHVTEEEDSDNKCQEDNGERGKSCFLFISRARGCDDAGDGVRVDQGCVNKGRF